MSERARKEGDGLVRHGKYSEAIKLYTKAIELNPSNPVYYAKRSKANYLVENYGKCK